MCAGIDLVSSSLSLPSPPFSLPKNFVAVALPFADISRRLNVKEEPRGNCVCTWKSRRAFHLATHRDSGRFHFPATKSDVSLRVFGGGARSKASDKLPRINDESGCRLVAADGNKEYSRFSYEKSEILGTSSPPKLQSRFTLRTSTEIESASSTFPLTAWYIYLKKRCLEFFRDLLEYVAVCESLRLSKRKYFFF